MKLLFFILCVFEVSLAKIQVAITFDDIPASGGAPLTLSRSQVTDKIIETLKKNKIGGVYGFLNGILVKNMKEREEILAKWKSAGHLLGNHTYSHLDLALVTAEKYIEDIERNESILIDYGSTIEEIKVFRYPFLGEGETQEKRYQIRSYLLKRKYKIAQVSIDFDDWYWLEPYHRCLKNNLQDKILELEKKYVEHAISRLKYMDQLSHFIYGEKREIKHILLLHFSSVTAYFLDRLLYELGKQNLNWISLNEAISDPIYKEDTSFLGAVGKTFFIQALESRSLNYSKVKQPQTPINWLNEQCVL